MAWIDTARTALQTELTPLASESYSRTYESLVKAQQLSELEELVEYKMWRRVIDRAGRAAVIDGDPTVSLGTSDVANRARETCESIRDRWLARLGRRVVR